MRNKIQMEQLVRIANSQLPDDRKLDLTYAYGMVQLYKKSIKEGDQSSSFRNITGFMSSREMVAYLNAFIEGLEFKD